MDPDWVDVFPIKHGDTPPKTNMEPKNDGFS